MPTDRTTLKRGPANVTFGGVTITPRDEVKLDGSFETFEVLTSTLSDGDTRDMDVAFDLSFTPDGQVTAGILSALYGWAGLVQGQSLVHNGDGADSNLVIHWQQDGQTMTFPAWAITKPADLEISAVKPPFGEVGITLLGKNNTPWSDAAKRLVLGTTDFANAANRAQIVTEAAALAWGTTEGSPWLDIPTQEGVKVNFELQTEKDETDADGLVDIFLQGIKASVTATPKGKTLAQLTTAAALQGAGAVRGRRSSARSEGDLIASNSGLYFILYGATLAKFPVGAGRAAKNRIGEVNWANTRSSDADPVFYLGTAAPA